MKLDEMMSTKPKTHFPEGKAYYQVSYEKNGETVSKTREYIHQAKLIYDEYKREDADGSKYPNLRLEEVRPDGSIAVLRGKKYEAKSSTYEYSVYEYFPTLLVTKGKLDREINSKNVARMPELIKSFGTFEEANDYALSATKDSERMDVQYSMYLFSEIEKYFPNLNYKDIVKSFTFFDPSTLDVVEEKNMTRHAMKETRRPYMKSGLENPSR